MTIKDYKAMILLETGNVITTATAKDLMSVDREHEAEAVTCGKYDVEPIDTPKRLHSEWCWEAMQAGADCRCGLFSYEDEQGAYIAAMNSPEEIENRAFDAEYNRLPSQSFCDEIPF
jgi:hypothetical protein